MTSVEQAAVAIRAHSTGRLKRLRDELAQDADAAEQFLRGLAEHPDPVVRDWAGWAAARVLPQESAVSLLKLLADDVDGDVRIEAQRFLVDLDKAWARRLVPKYRRALRGQDFIEVVDAIWRLTQFRAGSALPEIQELIVSAKDPAVRNNAQIAALVLAGREDELIAGLRAHDHVLCVLWARGLGYLATTRAIETLRDFAQTAPDLECRERAARILAKAHQIRPISAH